MVANWATLMVTNWATFAQLKRRQRGPVSNHEKLRLLFLKNLLKPHFYSAFWQTAFSKKQNGPASNH